MGPDNLGVVTVRPPSLTPTTSHPSLDPSHVPHLQNIPQSLHRAQAFKTSTPLRQLCFKRHLHLPNTYASTPTTPPQPLRLIYTTKTSTPYIIQAPTALIPGHHPRLSPQRTTITLKPSLEWFNNTAVCQLDHSLPKVERRRLIPAQP